MLNIIIKWFDFELADFDSSLHNKAVTTLVITTDLTINNQSDCFYYETHVFRFYKLESEHSVR